MLTTKLIVDMTAEVGIVKVGLRGYYSRHRIKGRLNVVIQGDSDVILLHIYMSVDFFAAIL